MTNIPTESERILANQVYVSNDTRATGLNNNDVVVGPSGAGKTRGYVIPNILNADHSLVVADTKGNLYRLLAPYLRSKGFEVLSIDFTNMKGSETGYNPLDWVAYDTEEQKYREQDIITVAQAICPIKTYREPYWEETAQMYLECLVSYVLDCLPKPEHTLLHVAKLADRLGTSVVRELFAELEDVSPDCFCLNRYRQITTLEASDKTDACVKSFLFNKLNSLRFDGATALFNHRKKIDFKALGKCKTVVFLTISDTDRSQDSLVNLFYTQALNTLMKSADTDYEDSRLGVPVRFIFDDFATNTVISHFDNITSVIRSREIYVSLVLQSLTQLEGLYGHSAAQTIMNNCDTCLYLGGTDVNTARYFGVKADKTTQTMLNMPLDNAMLFVRGQKPREVEKFRLEEHPAYREVAQQEFVKGINDEKPKDETHCRTA